MLKSNWHKTLMIAVGELDANVGDYLYQADNFTININIKFSKCSHQMYINVL